MTGCIAQGLACAVLALSPPVPFTTVGANVRASSDDLLGGRGQQVEPYLAIDPLDPSRLVGAAQEDRVASGAARANGVYASADGGTTWTRGLVPGVSTASGGRFDRATDPVVAFGPDGTAFYVSLALDFSRSFPTASAILVNRSGDGGASWSAPVTAARGRRHRLLDEPWLAVDGGAASPRPGAVYLSWNDGDLESMAGESRVVVTRSDDGGLSWRTPVVASGGAHIVGGARVAVGPDGTVHLLYAMMPLERTGRIETSHDFIRVASSTDGGATWTRAVTVAQRRYPFVKGLRVGSGTAFAVDASTGALHAVWTDSRRGAGDVVTSHLDAGASRWSRPVRVGSAADVQFTPAVAAAGGSVHLLFYDRAARHRCSVMYAQSLDGGATFRPPLRVSSAPFDPLRAERDFRGRFLGDYIGIAATASFAQAIWVDDRSPTGNDVYTARISG